MIVTKAPSEPWYIVRKTLEAMLAQEHPHDTGLADEDPQPETVDWCKANNVRISTRKGIAEYHQPTWPRRTKCKEGNLAYFYDTVGYKNYDIVVQLDADHVPDSGYLEAMIRPFVAPEVGYVAAPSICDANAADSWVVNARLFAEATMHGSLQAGYNNGWAPLCIGSHYAVRTIALKEIGGLGPELAEDHTTTLMMNACGWKGVFAFDAQAHGDGPSCFTDFLVQEFQWARSLMKVLLSVTPLYWKMLTPRLKFQFVFSQLWYPIFGISMCLGSLMPIIALLNDRPWVKVSYFEFLVRFFILTVTCIAPVIWLGTRGWLRPQNAKIINWEGMLFQLARWPWVVLGISSALIGWMLDKEMNFKVTPKGSKKAKVLPVRVLLPYVLLGTLSAVAVILCDRVVKTKGYYFLALFNAALYLGVSAAILWLHIRETQAVNARYWQQKLAIVGAATLVVLAALLRLPESVNVALGFYETSLKQRSAATTQVHLTEAHQNKVAFGVYDPDGDFKQEQVLIEHKFTPWRLENAKEFTDAVKAARQASRFPMVSLEPWPWEWNEMTAETLFQDIVSGKYDSTLENIFKAARQEAPQKIMLRWGHEMEMVGQYPWAKADSKGYIASYRYIVDFSRKMGLTNILWVWSPAGNKEAYSYWPGDEYVDYIGVSIYASKALDNAYGHAKTRSFEQLLSEKYWFGDYFKKPMIVAEFGVSDDVEDKSAWLADVPTSLNKFPKIKALIYFNQIQPEIVPFPIGQPNWGLNHKEVKILADSWKEFNNGRVSRKNIDEFLSSPRDK